MWSIKNNYYTPALLARSACCPTRRARGPRHDHAGQAGWIRTAKMAFSELWVLSVSGASLVPPAAGIPLRYASGTVSRALGAEFTKLFHYQQES
jgi:hypothetical protein